MLEYLDNLRYILPINIINKYIMVMVMDDVLNDKLIDCYNISSKVFSKYNELYSVMMEHYLEDNFIYEPYVSDILELVLEEYKVYSTLTLMDINMYLEAIDKSHCDDDMVGFRFKHKLKSLRDTYTGVKVNAYVLKLDIIPKDMNFNLFGSLISLIDIEMMRRIKYKLDGLSTDNYDDLSFVNIMYKEYNEHLLYQTFDNNLTEIICLKNNMDINNIPVIDMKNLINFINEILKLENDNYFNPVDASLISFAKIAIDRLITDEFENNPRAIFSFLALITRLEVIVDYMDRDSLVDLLNYCNKVKVNNDFGIDKIVNVIKRKIR